MLKRNPDVKIELPKGKTYGECIQAENNSVLLINGVFKATLQITNKPKPMSRKEALCYYGEKLNQIWRSGNNIQ